MERIDTVQHIPNYRPKKCTARELKKAGVTLVNAHQLHLRCDTCGRLWSPMIGTGGKIAKNYWQCPYDGCNKPE
jgi:hypothetical protein